ncbi:MULTISPECIES: hypothetical protein [unclassified Bacillus (in: firmicutes)]|uniref:hypothetical protein n=1 Tax=unclassified Bacillus (in: firmicutes) TaxID=185979 RepID=UPI0030FBA6A9
MNLIETKICVLILFCVGFFALVRGKPKLFVVSIILVLIGLTVLGMKYPEELKKIAGPMSL